MNFSFWEKSVFFDAADVLIIGSGIVGLNAAIQLKENNPKLKIQILERGMLPSGASTKNAGFACFGSITELLNDLKNHTLDEVFQLVELRWKGLRALLKQVGKSAIDYYPTGNYELFLPRDEAVFEKSMQSIDLFNDHMQSITRNKNTFVLKDYRLRRMGLHQFKHMVLNQAEGQINTGKMMRQLLAKAQSLDIQIWNNQTINRIEQTATGVQLFSQEGTCFKAPQLLICTNGFAQQLYPNLNVLPARNQVIVTSKIPNLKLNGCFHYDEGYVYFRNVGQRILLGGGRNRSRLAETTAKFGITPKIQDFLEHILQGYILPDTEFQIEHRWSGILGVGQQKKPIIQSLSKHQHIAVRMGGMGVAIGALVGQQAAQLVLKNL